jgi:hypothetical protein
MPERRLLQFGHLDDVMPEVERLLAGHLTVGRWSLGQVCNHLATAFRLLLEGGSMPAAKPVPEALRVRFFRRERFPDGVEAPPATLPPTERVYEKSERP